MKPLYETECHSCAGLVTYTRKQQGSATDCPHCAEPIFLPRGPRQPMPRWPWITLAILIGILCLGAALNTLSKIQLSQDTKNGLTGGVALVAILALGLALYFLPTITAGLVHNRNTLAIFALNLFLGWTFLGWVLAFVWALIRNPDRPAATTQQIIVATDGHWTDILGNLRQPRPPSLPPPEI